MAENSAISWTDHTHNSWWGCTKVGPGCDHCYAESFDKRVGGAHWGAGAPRRLVKDWSKPRKWDRLAAQTGVRPWVFSASMSDVFDNEVPDEWRERHWALVRETPNLNWIFVTKRIGNAARMLPPDWPGNFRYCGLVATVCNQAEADRDVPKLLATPAEWRGLSMEPLLGPVDLRFQQDHCDLCGGTGMLARWPKGKCHVCNGVGKVTICGTPRREGYVNLDWVIVGGESGPAARPMHPRWASNIRDQCAAAGVSFHFKQWGEWSFPERQRLGMDGECVWPDGSLGKGNANEKGGAGFVMQKVGKKVAGRLLDGIEHNGMPPATAVRP